MPAPMKKHRIKESTVIYFTYNDKNYAIPKNIADDYLVEKEKTYSVDEVFGEFFKKYTKAGALLKGTRAREDLTQVEFAKMIGVTQANLSAMENGKRPIGKIIAKRIEKIFKVNYRYFLE